jgi:hypothetical protein
MMGQDCNYQLDIEQLGRKGGNKKISRREVESINASNIFVKHESFDIGR